MGPKKGYVITPSLGTGCIEFAWDLDDRVVREYIELTGHGRNGSAGTAPLLFGLCALPRMLRALLATHSLADDAVGPPVHAEHRSRQLGPLSAAWGVRVAARIVAAGNLGFGWAVRADTTIAGEHGPAFVTSDTIVLGGRREGGRLAPLVTDVRRPESDASARECWTVPADLARRYADVSGDHNPIHVDAVAAREAGFERETLHGAALLAQVAGCVERHTGGSVIDCAARFSRPVSAGDDVTVSISPHESREAFAIDVQSGGARVLRGVRARLSCGGIARVR